MTRWRRLGRLCGVVAVLAALVGALAALGFRRLPTPPVTHPTSLASWADQHDPARAAMAIAWLAMLVLGTYALVVALLHLVAEALRARPVQALANLISLPILRRGLTAVAGMSLSVSTSLPVAAASHRPPAMAAVDQPGVATMRPLPPAGGGVATMRPLDADEGLTGAATMHPLANTEAPPAQAGPPPAELPLGRAGSNEPPAAVAGPDEPPSPTATPSPTWTVEPGDSFWHIAEETLGQQLGRAPSDAEIVPHWQALIERNRAHLADPTNPSLLFVGQVLNLPPGPAG